MVEEQPPIRDVNIESGVNTTVNNSYSVPVNFPVTVPVDFDVNSDVNIAIIDNLSDKRGFTSLNGAVIIMSTDTRKVLDVEVMSRYCNTCVMHEKLK